MRHSVTDEQLEINTELNDLRYQLIEEGMENYRLRQRIKKLKEEIGKQTQIDLIIFMIGLGLGLAIAST